MRFGFAGFQKFRRRSEAFGWAAFLFLVLGFGCGKKQATQPDPAGTPTEPEAAGLVSFERPTPASEFDSEVPLAWFGLVNRLAASERLTPPAASRILGYSGVTLYEAVVGGMPGYRSLAGQINNVRFVPQAHGNLHWPTVANNALAVLFKGMFESRAEVVQADLDSLKEHFNDEFKAELSRELFNRSALHGKLVGAAILAQSRRDGYFEFRNCAYTPPTGPGLWVPTPPAFAPALEPCWGELRPFVLRSGEVCNPGPPTAYSEDPASPFFLEAKEVYDVGNNLTDEQKTIAFFWADGAGTLTPPGHSFSILNQIIREKNLKLDAAAEAYAKLGMAEADAFISCWNTKFRYNLLRPITCIRDLIDPNWTSFIVTPPFPEYTSGHSVQSGAAAQVLTDLFGDVPFTDHTHDGSGLSPRSFDSFFAAAEEAAISRLYGGIHYRPAIELGIEQGKCIGVKVSALRFKGRGHSLAEH
ncbi:MAG: vanadium-dependent haloperoxidase [candidate division Zixibacteria bacterium]|nr:vanadium-dependent haloperoxidase [candidate division Zixibacteria bacterium]